ncbi:MAG: sulfatase-like hydrolase/transferase [Planctomycetaceae bacterium]
MRRFYLAAALSAACCLPSAALADRPNVLLVVSDDQGYGDVGGRGETNVDTPVINAIAQNGVRFSQFRVNPLCAPTRASLLSGQYSLECGMWRGPSRDADPDDPQARRLRDDVKLLPQFLKDAGYATGLFGKWHLGYESPNRPNDRGFDEFVGFLGGSSRYRKANTLLRNGEPFESDKHLTDLFTDEALAFIQKNRDRPFFCYVAYNAVHGPLWREEQPRPSGKEEWLRKYAERGIDFPRRDYCAVLNHLDHSVGRLLESLRALGLEENTLVIYVSDNGAITDKYPGDNGPLRGAKGSTYEGGIRVPAVMQWPGVIPAGTVSDANAVHFDIFSTVLAAAEVAVPERNGSHPVHGVSLIEHLKSGGKAPLPDRYLFWDLYGRMAALHADWKIVGEGQNHRGRFAEALPEIKQTEFELYRLSKDIAETQNVAAEHPEVYRDLKQRYVEWFEGIARQ